jgi:hypothetical protein
MAGIRCLRRLSYCGDSFNRFCGGTDYIDHHVGVGEHSDVAAGDLRRASAHPLGNEPLHVRVDGAVVLRDNVPAWLRFPRSSSDFCLNRSGAGTHWVAQTSFFSCSVKSPAKQSMPSGSSQIRPSATSM